MYLQVKLHKKHQNFQPVLWRESTEKPVETYRLTTVTFGLTPSSFLAIQQLANDVKESHPLASDALLNGFYVDDLVYGANSTQKALDIQKQLKESLSSAGFTLRKWASNHSGIVAHANDSDMHLENIDFSKLKSLPKHLV